VAGGGAGGVDGAAAVRLQVGARVVDQPAPLAAVLEELATAVGDRPQEVGSRANPAIWRLGPMWWRSTEGRRRSGKGPRFPGQADCSARRRSAIQTLMMVCLGTPRRLASLSSD